MSLRSVVEGVIYFYLSVCVLLLLFNIFYIFRSKRQKKLREKRVKIWKKLVSKQPEDAPIPNAQLRKLKRIENLTAYYAALEETILNTPRAERFFRGNARALQTLALEYGKKSVMERAFFAYFIASFRTSNVGRNNMLFTILLSYLEDSTVYCRENVLQALYALGSEQVLEQALSIFHERGWYHNPKLLSDGMVRYTGNKEDLVLRLWKHRTEWGDFLTVGVVQFATSFHSTKIARLFCEALQTEVLPYEVRFALVRYFQRHVYLPARNLLFDYIRTDQPLAIPAAAALRNYPGGETKAVLKDALRSRNWYVRRNAAMSLKDLGITPAEWEEIRAMGDRYALEMLEYVFGVANASNEVCEVKK